MPYIGCCGDDCELCPRYIASQINDVAKLIEAAILWKKVGLREKIMSPEEMICLGCLSLAYCHYDNIRECARNKGISNCGKCMEYPCDSIKEVFNRTNHYARQCEKMCDSKDYKCLQKAFFSKKEKLDSIHLEYIADEKKRMIKAV